MDRLIYSVHADAWGSPNPQTVINDIRRMNPLIIRISNFDASTEAVLAATPEDRIIVWKIEYMGDETPHAFLKSDRSIDPEAHLAMVRSFPHRLSAYTFTDFNRDRIPHRLPAAADLPLRVLPIAQKTPARCVQADLDGWYPELPTGKPAGRTYGVSGLLSPTKGIDQLVEGFTSWEGRHRDRLLCAVMAPHRSSAEVHAAWSRRLGADRVRNIHVRVGRYGEWSAMSAFYQLIDVLLVNSIHESWGRIVTEAVGTHTPVVIRRARCATNHTVPGATIVEDLSFGSALDGHVRTAATQSTRLAEFVRAEYATDKVRATFLREVVGPLLTRKERAVVDRALSDKRQRDILDETLAY